MRPKKAIHEYQTLCKARTLSEAEAMNHRPRASARRAEAAGRGTFRMPTQIWAHLVLAFGRFGCNRAALVTARPSRTRRIAIGQAKRPRLARNSADSYNETRVAPARFSCHPGSWLSSIDEVVETAPPSVQPLHPIAALSGLGRIKIPSMRVMLSIQVVGRRSGWNRISAF